MKFYSEIFIYNTTADIHKHCTILKIISKAVNMLNTTLMQLEAVVINGRS
jgi:hypothetical protein